jgi:non-ribosomal peptide synthetase component F
MALLAGLHALLHGETGEEDLVIGFPFAQRGRPEIDALIGPFVNALALRTRLDGDPTFRELVGRVRQTVLAAQAHQEVPIEKLAEDLGREGRAPFFQVAASLQNVPSPDLQVATFRMTLLPPIAWTAQLDLSCDMKEMPEGVRVSWRYRRSLFTAPEVACLADGYLALLAEAGRHPERRLSELSSGTLRDAGGLEVVATP